MITVVSNTNNDFPLFFKKYDFSLEKNVPLTESEISEITRVDLEWDGELFSSETLSEYFNFTVLKEYGAVSVQLGMLGFNDANQTIGNVHVYVATADKPEGVYWFSFMIKLGI
jgi:hypothetical protein